MRISIQNIYCKKFNDVSFTIEDNKITGIIGNVGSGKTVLANILSTKIPIDDGKIVYDTRSIKGKIGIISDDLFSDMLDGTVEQYIKRESIEKKYRIKDIDKRVNEMLKIIGLPDKLLKRQVNNISKGEKIKTLLSRILLYNPDLIILDGVVEELDSKAKNNLFKLLIKLKKFYKKTIIITTCNIDNIFSLVDNVVLIGDNNVIAFGEKFDVYNNLLDKTIRLPLSIEFKNKLKEKKNVDLGNNDTINELIKAIYREVR